MVADRHVTRILHHHGGKLLGKAIDRALAPAGAAPGAKPTLARRLGRIALLRVATRSVPGAIIVGASIVAKHLLEQRRTAQAAAGAAERPPGKR